MKKIFLLTACALLSAAAMAQTAATKPDPFQPVRFMVGDWVGEASGEPGKGGVDQMAILIFETANQGNVVLNVPLQGMTTGNLQAHYDQPHGGNGNK